MPIRSLLGMQLGIGVSTMLASIAVAATSVAPTGGADSGWYSDAQAQQGHQLFNNLCAQCHRPDLTGALGPPLVGPAFLQHWGNKPLSELYDFEHSQMPAVNPGSVPDAQMWPITAYILQRNGFPPGGTVLGPDTGAKRVLATK